MSANAHGAEAVAAAGPRKLKILMLHGYTQSGPIFHAKTRALEKQLQKAFPASPPAGQQQQRAPGALPSYPGGVQLIYPTGPWRLQPADIPSYDAAVAQTSASPSSAADGDGPDAWAWWRKSDAPGGPYVGLTEALETVRQAIAGAGGVDGVVGFSQGAAFAGIVASLLEPGRASALSSSSSASASSFAVSASWLALCAHVQPPLKFAVSYAGFYAPSARYRGFYEPPIATRFLHVVGSLDSVVEEERSAGFAQRCADRELVTHPGGHFVPVGKAWAAVLVAFLRDVLGREEGEGEGEGEGKGQGTGPGEESVAEMEMPF